MKRANRPGIDELEQHALAIRRHVVRLVARNGQGYVQQGLGAAEIFTHLWFAEAELDPSDPSWACRDRIFLSTAHNSALFHATLAERGLIPMEKLQTYTKDGSQLEINVSERLGRLVEATCGSLGQGLSVAAGSALSARRRGQNYRCYVILGDGELQEGQVWEATMFAASNKLGNLHMIIDYNDMQVDGSTRNVITMEPIAEKFAAFGWAVSRVDGHDFKQLADAFDDARDRPDQPTVIIADTIVGKGVSFLEGKKSHNMVFPQEVAELALSELGAR
ncbi:MAG: transketolase [Mesorhizobium sp.]|nr:MAG: transketolase [Mesorhizobium sp.]